MQTLRFALEGVSVRGAIVDVETVSLKPAPNGIFTFGWLTGGEISILQAEDEADCKAMAAQIAPIWHALPRPIYAYNKGFTEDWLSDALGKTARIDRDLMEPWKGVADRQALKWPRLRELLRPPVFNYRWGVADYDRTHDPRAMRRAIRIASSVSEVVSREAVGGAPHLWWRQHLELMADPRAREEIERLSRADAAPGASRHRSARRLPNGSWTTSRLAAIVCHNLMDLQSQASLLFWQGDAISGWQDGAG